MDDVGFERALLFHVLRRIKERSFATDRVAVSRMPYFCLPLRVKRT
jgi:hypothetical protein